MPYWKKGAWAAVGFFAFLAWTCLVLSYQKYGTSFVHQSLSEIKHDALLLYAIIDLFAIFVVLSIWGFKDAKEKGIRFWPWMISFFIFGTPAFLIYLLYSRRRSITKST